MNQDTKLEPTLDDVVSSCDIYDAQDVRGFYACFVIDELCRWAKGMQTCNRDRQIDIDVEMAMWAVVDAFIHNSSSERLIRNDVIGVIDHLELIGCPERNGEAIDRLHKYEDRLKAKRLAKEPQARESMGLVIKRQEPR
jgi:hypothetical protein